MATKSSELDVKNYLLTRIGGNGNYGNMQNYLTSDRLPTPKDPAHIVAARKAIAKYEESLAEKEEAHKARVIKLRVAAREAVYTKSTEDALAIIHDLEAELLGSDSLDEQE